MSQIAKKVSFQGFRGANSDMASRTLFPGCETLPCLSFEEAFRAVQEGRADLAVIPVDNNLAGRVADVHHLIPRSGLSIIGEYFMPIRFALMAVKGAKVEGLKHVYSHVHAFPQCRKIVKDLGLQTHIHADTAGAAADVAQWGKMDTAALAPLLAADIYGLAVLADNVQDTATNMTRFLVFSPEALPVPYDPAAHVITSLVFRVRNIPAALYKSLGGFATNGLNIVKIESYVDELFQAAQFYCEIEGHPEARLMQLALKELGFFAEEYKVLGTYPAHEFRKQQKG
ncbi:MAG: prephenate dehydratase [Alphaproteobacteria bacterium]|nr:prephenate dehydratase [Alphaproteobacteria bacterium]